MKKLVIFDMDGVLLDSEKLYMDMNQLFFKQLGASVSIEEHQTFVGISATRMWTYIKDKFNRHYKRHPKECVVIEDGTNGVAAAKAAGMTCIGFNNPGSGKQDLSLANHIMDNFNDRAFRALFW